MPPSRPALPRFGLVAAAPLGVALPAAASAEWRDIPYPDVIKMPLLLDKVDPQHIYAFRMQARPGKGLKALPADFRLQLKVQGKLVPIAVAADGRVELPVHRDWAEAGAVLQSNQPKGAVGLSMDLDARTPPGTRMGYARLTESAEEMAGRHRRNERAAGRHRPDREVVRNASCGGLRMTCAAC